MEIKNIYDEIGRTQIDPSVGIARAEVAKGKSLSFHIAIVSHMVNPHYHKKGDELYLIISGKGIMSIAPVKKGKAGKWALHNVRKGDTFIVPEMFAHKLENADYNGKLILAFACPSVHLTTDRHLLP